MPAFEGGVCRIGKHTGKHISEVPDGYLEWMKKDSEENLVIIRAELDRRKNKVDGSYMMKIIQAGFQQLRGQYQSGEEHAKLQYAFDNLEQAVKDAGKVGES